ncbi:MAG: PAAR-like domain-containing protein [Pseudomonadota bacterium]
MGNVFANGKEVSSKKTTNKSAPAMMSVCLSPPSPPAGPIPIPYPVSDMASNTTDGTGSVYIKKKEVGKKNGSNYKKCNGNQPATRNFGMDVVSHTIQGKTKFQAYSFDVMFEKHGAERFMDMTTTNHSNTGTAVTISAASVAITKEMQDACKKLRVEVGRMRRASNEASSRDQRKSGHFQREVSRTHGALTASVSSTAASVTRRTSNQLNASACMFGDDPMKVEPKSGTKSKKSTVCGGGVPYDEMKHKHHTEAQILENVDWNNQPKWIAIATDWAGYDADTGVFDPDLQDGPCNYCKKKLDEACACGVAIIICDSDGNAKNHCK